MLRTLQQVIRSNKLASILAGGSIAVLAIAIPLTQTLGSSPHTLFTLSSGSDPKIATGDMAIWNPATYSYVAGDELSDKAGSGNVYRIEAQGDANNILGKLGRLFNVSGTPTTDPYGGADKNLHMLGSADGSGPNIVLYTSGTGDWYYSSNTFSAGVGYACPTSSDGKALPCDKPANLPKVNLPSEADARAEAARIFSATGLTVSPEDIVMDGSDTYLSASASLSVEGMQTSLTWYVTWAGPEIASASGHIMALSKAGSYDTVSPKQAVERLSDWRWTTAGGPYPVASMKSATTLATGPVAVGAPVKAESSNGSTGATSGSGSTPAGTPTTVATPPDVKPSLTPSDGATVTSLPEPTTLNITLTITASEPAMLVVYDADGNAWLVPGHRMTDDQQGIHFVIALPDGVIALPKDRPVMMYDAVN